MRIYGVDFTSRPRKQKPITVASGLAARNLLRLERIERLETFESFEAFLRRPGPWVGGFDFPFGLPRQAIVDLGWPTEWTALVARCSALGRERFKRTLDAYRESRPGGSRYAKRSGDVASGAHPSVKLVNPPVGFMFLEGAPRLAIAGLHVPGLRPSTDTRVAVEAYPGMLVKRLGLGSYKSDERRKQTPARLAVRRRIVAALREGSPLNVRFQLDRPLMADVIADGTGDLLDAAICAVQAHWGWQRRASNHGLPVTMDPVEGWIVSA